ncbi:phage minor capsid protein [Streptomyces sp. NPDC058746]|uniref:phage minor capsid protein n=1 Tax=Streptomyces sp. NPDC058746 TaxID=3346622 RepID=UPI0036C897D1
MAIHPGMVEDLATGTRDLYAQAELRLIVVIARRLADGLEAPDWAERKLAAVQQLRRASQSVVDELGDSVSQEVRDAVARSYDEGHRAAVAELGALSDDARRLVDDAVPNARAVDRLVQETVGVVASTHRSILRAVEDTYRSVVAEVSATPLIGSGTRGQAAQDAMRRFADQGISGFTDKAGRRWRLDSYAEMAVRTAVGRAATEAHMRTLSEAGIELVVVSDAPRECPLCRRWEGRVLALSGPAGARTVEVEHAIEDGRMVSVEVAGTLDEARLAGFQHPNCRHSVSAYTPGVTRVQEPANDPDGYRAGQRRREIERNIRKHRRREAAAVTPEAKKAAAAKTRQWQGALREHLAARPELRRERGRAREGAPKPPAQREATRDAAERVEPDGGPDADHAAARQPRELMPGRATRTLRQMRAMPHGRERYKGAEDYVRGLAGGAPERHYRVPKNDHQDHPVDTPGGRHVDVPVDMPDGRTLAVEVKHYLEWRTITLEDGSQRTVRGEVPLSAGIKQQIHKDLALRRANPRFDPRWVFVHAPPSQALRDYLIEARIIFVEYGPAPRK